MYDAGGLIFSAAALATLVDSLAEYPAEPYENARHPVMSSVLKLVNDAGTSQ